MNVHGRARKLQGLRRTRIVPVPGQMELDLDLDLVRVDPPKPSRARRVHHARPELALGPLVRRPRPKPGPTYEPFHAVREDIPNAAAGPGNEAAPDAGAGDGDAEQVRPGWEVLLAAGLGAAVVAVHDRSEHAEPPTNDAEERAGCEALLAAERDAELLAVEYRWEHGEPPPDDDASYWGSEPDDCGCAGTRDRAA